MPTCGAFFVLHNAALWVEHAVWTLMCSTGCWEQMPSTGRARAASLRAFCDTSNTALEKVSAPTGQRRLVDDHPEHVLPTLTRIRSVADVQEDSSLIPCPSVLFLPGKFCNSISYFPAAETGLAPFALPPRKQQYEAAFGFSQEGCSASWTVKCRDILELVDFSRRQAVGRGLSRLLFD